MKRGVRGQGQGWDRAAASLQQLWDFLEKQDSGEIESVVSASVFRTQEPSKLLSKMRDAVLNEPTVRAMDLSLVSRTASVALYSGRISVPQFQKGESPFKNSSSGGGIELDILGVPIVQRSESVRFSLTIPTVLPQGKSADDDFEWPVVLYAHGTGGDHQSFVGNGVAKSLGDAGFAVLSMDQVLHGDRIKASESPELLFFNFLNPKASRSNVLQAASEEVQLMRLLDTLVVPVTSGMGRQGFSADKRYFFGHSQGALIGLPFVAQEPSIDAAVFSGAGALLSLSLLNKTEPVDIPSLLGLLIRDREIDAFHPALSLLQSYYEPADAISYSEILRNSGGEGVDPIDILQVIGLDDSYTPQESMDALATSLDGNILSPELESIAGLALRGRQALSSPLVDNREPRKGIHQTIAITQHRAPAGSDGHFVAFQVAEAQRQTVQFLQTSRDSGSASVSSSTAISSNTLD